VINLDNQNKILFFNTQVFLLYHGIFQYLFSLSTQEDFFVFPPFLTNDFSVLKSLALFFR
jgi:hypothetical protein